MRPGDYFCVERPFNLSFSRGINNDDQILVVAVPFTSTSDESAWVLTKGRLVEVPMWWLKLHDKERTQ